MNARFFFPTASEIESKENEEKKRGDLHFIVGHGFLNRLGKVLPLAFEIITSSNSVRRSMIFLILVLASIVLIFMLLGRNQVLCLILMLSCCGSSISAHGTTVDSMGTKVFPRSMDKRQFLAEFGPDMERCRFKGFEFFCQQDSVLFDVDCVVGREDSDTAALVAAVPVRGVYVICGCCRC